MLFQTVRIEDGNGAWGFNIKDLPSHVKQHDAIKTFEKRFHLKRI